MASTLGAGLEESSGAGECTSHGMNSEEFFPNVSKIAYEGPDSTNPLAFHYYNAEEVIMGKPMKDWCAAPIATTSPDAFLPTCGR